MKNLKKITNKTNKHNDSKVGKILWIASLTLTAVAIPVATVIGYDLGVSNTMDDYMGASECKPSRKWRHSWQR